MTDKYAREMMLVPKDTPWLKPPVPFLPDPSFQWGRGEQATPDPNEAYWKRQFLTDQLVNACHGGHEERRRRRATAQDAVVRT